MRPIYLDYNASTPIAPEVAEAMLPYLREHFGNPSSGHAYGAAGRAAIEWARVEVAALLGAGPSEVVFTSGGTESNNLAIWGAVQANLHRGDHVITSAIEHPSVAEVFRWLGEQGVRVTVLPVDEHARVRAADLEATIDEHTVLVSVMHANNEVGTLQPIPELAEIARRNGALMHTDAAQSIGKVPADVRALGVDLLTVAGHKFYAPKGVGALFVREGVELVPILHGAGHERGLRPGTENVLEIVGLGAAAGLVRRELARGTDRLSALRNRLLDGLTRGLGPENVRWNGNPAEILPNTLSVALRGQRADEVLARISDRVAASAGSACHSGEVTISPVLRAMGLDPEWAAGTLRLSVGRYTTEGEIDEAVQAVAGVVRPIERTESSSR